MPQEKPADLNKFQLAGLGVLVSMLVTGSVLLILHFTGHSPVSGEKARARKEAIEEGKRQSQTEPAPIQPAIDIEMESRVPRHFTEDVLIPGYTETGQQILEEDDTLGRSPEGV